MAQEVKDTSIAAGSDMSELLTNISNAKKNEWIVSGPIVKRAQHLNQTLIKLGPVRAE